MKVTKYKKWTFDRLQDNRNPSINSLSEDGILLKEYAPEIFQQIRHLNHVSHIYLRDLFFAQLNDQFQSNMTHSAGGRSGCFFYFTSDHQFIIKSISKEEKQVLLGRFLKEYFSKIHDSLLARIYGVYEVTLKDQEPFSFMLMGNIATPELEVIGTFDIKGSKVNRRVAEATSGSLESLGSYRVYKDQDFENYVGSVTPYSGSILMNKLKTDVHFLQEHGILDYSLLLKICKPTSDSNPFLFHGEEHSYCIGMIDFLQKFTCKKQAEVKLKSLVNSKDQISIQNPRKYAERFLKKIQGYVKTFQLINLSKYIDHFSHMNFYAFTRYFSNKDQLNFSIHTMMLRCLYRSHRWTNPNKKFLHFSGNHNLENVIFLRQKKFNQDQCYFLTLRYPVLFDLLEKSF